MSIVVTHVPSHAWSCIDMAVVRAIMRWFDAPSMPSSRANFSEWFRAILVEHDLSQYQAAKLLGVPVTTVSRWARAKNLPSYEQLLRINEVFGQLPPGFDPGETPEL